jgi:hypothetical protein
MLRALIVALLIANAAFFAWTRGWLDGVVGVRAIGDREPERLLRQVRPELIRILPDGAASEPAPPAAALAPACFEAGPFTEAELASAQSAAQAALPAGSWAAVRTEQAASWIVYMGRYASREAMTRKEDELKRRQAGYDEVLAPPALAPGLSLGRFDQRAAATAALEQFARQGIRTARVVELEPARVGHVVRIDQADAALSARLAATPLELLGKGFVPCAKPPGG